MQHNPLPAAQRGMTLLELLAAMAVTAILAALAFGALDQVMRARDQGGAVLSRLAEVQTALTIIEDDLRHAADRAVRDEHGERLPAIRNALTGALLELTRTGRWVPASAAISSLRRVAYWLEDGTLVRQEWAVLDRAQESAPWRTPLLTGVSRFDTERLDDPAATAYPHGAGTLPRGMRVHLDLKDWGQFRRVILMAGA